VERNVHETEPSAAALVASVKAAATALLQIAAGVVAFAVVITAGAWAAHGMVLLIGIIP
jgi:hypothetical protein